MSDDVMTEAEIVSMIDAEMSRLKGLLRVAARDRDTAREQALLFVADDLRRAAEAHLKTVGITGKRVERKHLAQIADVLLERAKFYEQQSQAAHQAAPTEPDAPHAGEGES